jgi:hypothetical protein
MSLAVVYSRALAGLDAPLVRVEVHVGGGLQGGCDKGHARPLLV